MTLLGLIAATYFMVSGGPYGTEDLIGATGYGIAIAILCLVPFLWALPTALMVGELAAAIPDTGGFYVWVQRALGKFWGFQEAWLSLAASIFDMGIYPLLFIAYLGVLSPSMVAGWRGPTIATALVAACLLWNLRGAHAVGNGSTAMGIAMVSPFVILATIALCRAHAVPATTVTAHPSGVIMGGVMIAMWNYMGWDNASTIATEVENPQRNYPRAMLGALALILVSYIIPISMMWHYGVPVSSWTTGSWAAIGGTVGGWLIRDAIVVGGMISSAGILNSLMMSYSRLPAALAEDHYLPPIFKKVNQASVPLIALFALSTVWLAALGLNFNRLVMLDILLYGSSLMLEFIALAVLRWKEPDLERPFRVPGGKVGAVLIGVAPAALLLFSGIYSEHNGVLLGLGVIALGPLLWWATSLFPYSKPDPIETSTQTGAKTYTYVSGD